MSLAAAKHRAVSREPMLARKFAEVRQVTTLLAAPLSAEDACVQSMADASPAKWHLAHTAWFFETFLLRPQLPGYRAFHPQFEMLFNSYYHGVGAMHPRAQRGLLTRPALQDVLAYRAHVDAAMGEAFERQAFAPATLDLITLGLHHEQQHQELLLTDVKHLFAQNPTRPVYRAQELTAAAPRALRWWTHDGGIVNAGHAGADFSFDNEGPAHRVLLRPFALASRPVTNAEYRAFIDDGGYRDPRLWLSEGWALVAARDWQRPLYWSAGEDSEFTLHGEQAIDPHRPVCHVSFFEADAYARWAGARLPTEFEWEQIAISQRIDGQFVDRADARSELHPRLLDEPAGSLYGSVWTWTASPYLPYPGFAPAAGAVGEYNGKFMCNQWVLRGGSCASSRSHLRPTYRNFFPADARWQFSGLRLAKEIS